MKKTFLKLFIIIIMIFMLSINVTYVQASNEQIVNDYIEVIKNEVNNWMNQQGCTYEQALEDIKKQILSTETGYLEGILVDTNIEITNDLRLAFAAALDKESGKDPEEGNKVSDQKYIWEEVNDMDLSKKTVAELKALLDKVDNEWKRRGDASDSKRYNSYINARSKIVSELAKNNVIVSEDGTISFNDSDEVKKKYTAAQVASYIDTYGVSNESEDVIKAWYNTLKKAGYDEYLDALNYQVNDGEEPSTGVLGNSNASASHTPDEIIGEAQDFINSGNATTTINGDNLTAASSTLYNILLSIGIFLAVAIGMYLGVKFMMSSAEDKAKVKEALIPYIAGCIVIFSAFIIWKLAITLLSGIDKATEVSKYTEYYIEEQIKDMMQV